MKISVIIPVVNEAKHIKATLATATKGENIEIIVVDGGSSDQTVELVKSFPNVVLYTGSSGRARQMNLGAAKSKGEVFLFLHGDSLLPPEWDQQIRHTLQKSDILAGAFKFQVDYSSLPMRIIEGFVALRSIIFQSPYGDQGIFIRSSTFRELGGYMDAPVMEDYELMKKVRKKSRIKILNSPVITSGRRWKSKGVLRTTLINQSVIAAYRLGISPRHLQSWYKKL